jgi:hypothetical protein
MKYTTKQRVGALVVWALLILLTRYGGWYEDAMPEGLVVIPSWPKTLIGTTLIMLVGLRLRKLYWGWLMEKLGASDE